MKIGISPHTPSGKLKKPEMGERVIKHVIGKFSPKEEPSLEATLARTTAAAHLFITAGAEAAFMKANTA
jgi:peptidyl-tRNA hydrolase